MLSLHAASSYLLAMGLAALLTLIVIWQRQRNQKAIVVWLASAVVGMLFGSVASFAAVQLSGYELVKAFVFSDVEDDGEENEEPEMGGGGRRGGGMGGGMFGGPRPKRDLTTLVRKLEILTSDIVLDLSPQQAKAVIEALKDVDQEETMTDDEAQVKHDEIIALLAEDQQSRLSAISIPRNWRRGGGGGPGGFGGADDPDANPFQQEDGAQALTRLRERFAEGGGPADSSQK